MYSASQPPQVPLPVQACTAHRISVRQQARQRLDHATPQFLSAAHLCSTIPGCAAAYCSESCPSACADAAAAAAAVALDVASPACARAAASASRADSTCTSDSAHSLENAQSGKRKQRIRLSSHITYLPCIDRSDAVSVLALILREPRGRLCNVDSLNQIEGDVLTLLKVVVIGLFRFKVRLRFVEPAGPTVDLRTSMLGLRFSLQPSFGCIFTPQ